MKKTIYVLAVTLVIATLVISSTASIPIKIHATEEETTPEPLATVTDYFSIPAAAFNPSGDIPYSNAGTYLNAAGVFYAPVYLPNNATVTKLLFYWADYNGADDGIAKLRRYAFGGVSPANMAIAYTSGSTSSGASEDNSIDYAEIDNSQYSYFAIFEAPSTVILNNVIIEYNYEPEIVPVNRNVNRNRQMSNNAKNPVIFPLNGDNFIQRFRRLLTGEIIDVDISDSAAINASKIDGVPSHNHDERYYTQTEVDALLSNCTGYGVINIEDKYGMTTSAADGGVTITYDAPFPDTDYFIFVRVTLVNDFDPGSGNIPAGTVVDTCSITKSTANFKAIVCYGPDDLKGADVDIFYITIEQ